MNEANKDTVADTKRSMEQWRQDRSPYEMQWFLNSALRRGEHYVEWHDKYQRLVSAPAAPTRIRITANRTQAKLRARRSKFLRNRYQPLVTAATNEYRDYLNARMTQRALTYVWDSKNLESTYLQALLWAEVAGKGFWWFHWDPSVMARVAKPDPETGTTTYSMEQLGDVLIEAGSPFEVLVKDPGIARISRQPEIMRLTLRDLATYKKRFPEEAHNFQAAGNEIEAFRYEKQIASLNPTTGRGTSAKGQSESRNQVLVIEHFIAPTGELPQGEYRLIVGDVLVKQEELPYGFVGMDNPYPVVEFADSPTVGQFWCPALVEQLSDIQRQYNLVLSKLAEHVRVAAHPKLLVAKQHSLNRNAWTQDGGEVVEYTAHMHIGPPQQLNPPQLSNDLWQIINLLQGEFDTLMQIWPVSEGGTAGTNSGYQANLLQEAANTVHGPDLRMHELALLDAFRKIRKLMKDNYTVPRLLAVSGPNYLPEAMEFSGAMVDEFADLRIEVGSGLPELKSARQEFIMKLYNSSLIGDPADPDTRRKAMSLLELGSMEEAFDATKLDENQARLENMLLTQQGVMPDVMFWENHQLHYNLHTAWLKSPEAMTAPPNLRELAIRHAIGHARYIDINAALQIAQEQGFQDLVQDLTMRMQAMAPPPGVPQGQGQEAPPPPNQAPVEPGQAAG